MEEISKDLISNGMNINTYNLLFDDINNKISDKKGSCESLNALCVISKFTKFDDIKIYCLMAGMYETIDDYDFRTISWSDELNSFIYQKGNFKIPFNLLSDFMTHEDVKKELTSDERLHKCHEKSILLASIYPNFRIITGYVYLEKQRMLHSVIEYDDNEETIILDWTKNLRMLKEDYIRLTNLRVIETIEGYDVKNDITGPIIQMGMDFKTYCAFRPEIVKELKKNNSIF
ncbi:unknown [Firmicutes bacterium CAG:582]|nr:unknown [Firmicutes bacterium CAG:582]